MNSGCVTLQKHFILAKWVYLFPKLIQLKLKMSLILISRIKNVMQVIYRELDLVDDFDTQQWLVSSIFRMMFHHAQLTLLLPNLKPLHYFRDNKCTFSWKKNACMLITSSQKSTHLWEDVEYLPPVKVRWIPFHSRQEVENFSANQRHGGHPDFFNQSKNRNLVKGVAILLPAKFPWIPFSGCRGVENVSVNQRLGWQSWFSIFPDVNFGYMCPMTLTLEISPWSSSWITLGSWWILWNNILTKQ